MSWAALGLIQAEAASRFSIVRLTITALNACVGALFIARGAVVRRASPGRIIVALPSIVMSAVALKIAGPIEAFPRYASIVFACGGGLTVLSLAVLGRCFALLPAVRGVVTGGPFRVVRHPAYAGELAMLIGCALASPTPRLAWLVAITAGALLAARILAEESALGELPAYRDYRAKVRSRLIPGIW